MKKLLAATVLFCAASAFAQSDPVLGSARQVLEFRQRNLVAAAELMPAEKYGYKPTDAQMTFAHLVHHTAEANLLLCARVAGDEPKPVTAGEDAGKDALLAALRQSFAYCTDALGRARDASLGEETPLFGNRRGPRAAALLSLAGTWASHYSIAAIYLRLNDILPPTARPAQPASGPAHNESNAVGVLRSINTAQVTYHRRYQQGYACDLERFGPPPEGQKPSAERAHFLDASVSARKPRHGYRLSLSCTDSQAPHQRYRTAAVPEKPGEMGSRAFCSDETGLIAAADDGTAETCFERLARGEALN